MSKENKDNAIPLEALQKEVGALTSAVAELTNKGGITPDVKQHVQDELAKFEAKVKAVTPVGKPSGEDEAPSKFNTADEILAVSPNSPSYTDEVRKFHDAADAFYLMDTLKQMAGREAKGNLNARDSRLYKDVAKASKKWFGESVYKQMDTQTAGEGLEWVPTGFSETLQEFMRLEHKVAALHTDITMPRNPFVLPVQTGRIVAKLGAELSTASGTVVPTGNVTLTATKFIGYVPWSYELDLDSIVAVLPAVRRELGIALTEGIENAIINGDTGATHMDFDVEDANDATDTAWAWKGYRDYALVQGANHQVDFSGADPSEALFRSMRVKAGKFGVKPSQLAWVVSISTYLKMLSFSNFLTLDKYGPKATILTGELGSFDGIPVVVSEYVRQDVAAAGVNEQSGPNTLTTAHLVHRPSWVLGTRGGVIAETDRVIRSQQLDMVTSVRKAFMPTRTGETIAILGRNIKVS